MIVFPYATARPAPSTSTTGVKRDDGTQTVALEATSGVTSAQLVRADRLLNTTIADLPTWNTTAKAEAAGYRSIGDSVTGDEHYVNWSYVDDAHILDPKHPESLVYEWRNGEGIKDSKARVRSFQDLPNQSLQRTRYARR